MITEILEIFFESVQRLKLKNPQLLLIWFFLITEKIISIFSKIHFP